MASTLTIEDYLSAKTSGYMLSDDVISAILADREIDEGTLVADMERKDVDLALADAYMQCVLTAMSSSGTVEDADGNWSHKEGGYEISSSDRSRLVAMAKALYAKWGVCWTYSLSNVRIIKL